ncbi:MAG: DNA recombination protein RmuC [Salinibacter sp.]
MAEAGFKWNLSVGFIHVTESRNPIESEHTMDLIQITIAFVAGFILGVGAVIGWRYLNGKASSQVTEQLRQPVGEMEQKLDKVDKLVRDLEKDRENKFGQVTNQLQTTSQEIQNLHKVANSLSEVLASPKKRGEWGERQAEDVLRIAGFQEGINYFKQETQDSGSRPDFTFPLPNGLKLHMDVKFPHENYRDYVNAESDQEAEQHRKTFLRNVRNKLKQVTDREYVNPEGETVDCVLLFVPNEQIYAFIEEQDPSILEEALRQKVIVCSPVTLFAVLAVIRQAADNFTLERTSDEILKYLGQFKKQWVKFTEKVDKLGKSLQTVQNHYDDLSETRSNQLEQPLNKLEELRNQRGLELDSDDGDNY